jgi:hypothetical protein
VAVALILLYRDVARALGSTPYGYPIWPRFEEEVYYPHRAYFEGLVATYGEESFGEGGLRGAIERAAPQLREQLRHAHALGLEGEAQRWLEVVAPRLTWTLPNIYVGTLLYTAPAATLSVLGRPAIALGVERFQPGTPTSPAPGQTKYWYAPAEIAEMIPHEAAHVARMQALELSASPRKLSLLDMVMLEGTALTFTDLLVGRPTLATFMPPQQLAWHQANDAAIREAVAQEYAREGMEVFTKYFTTGAPVSGYWVGYSLCAEWLRRHGTDQIGRLVGLPSAEILAGLT